MTTKDEEKDFLTQEEKARTIFWWIFGLLVVWIFGLVVFQFGLFKADTKADWAKYLRWLFAALIGASTYLLWNVAYWFQKIRADDKSVRADFNKYQLWYPSTMTRAPILAIVLLWILTTTTISIGGEDGGTTGLDLTLKDLNDFVLLGVAFIFGYYGRVALSQLDLITKTFFPKAWALAVQGFEVAAPKILLLKEKFTFTTDPVSDVVWSATPTGSMEAETGIYTAPEDLANIDKKVIIRAALKNEPSVTGFKEVILKLFKIDGKESVEVDEKDIKYSLKSNVVTDEELAKAAWTLEGGGSLSAATGKEVTFTTPALDPKDKEKKVTLKVTVDHEGSKETKLEITVKPKA